MAPESLSELGVPNSSWLVRPHVAESDALSGAFFRYSHLWLLYGFRIGSDRGHRGLKLEHGGSAAWGHLRSQSLSSGRPPPGRRGYGRRSLHRSSRARGESYGRASLGGGQRRMTDLGFARRRCCTPRPPAPPGSPGCLVTSMACIFSSPWS